MTAVHVVGAGMSGLAAAVRLTQAGRRVALYDMADHAGGRCRSFHDSILDRRIDNGNHLMVSGNWAVRDYLAAVGARDALHGPPHSLLPFIDVSSGKSWTVRFCDGPILGRLPLPPRGVPGATLGQFLAARRLKTARADDTVADVLDTSSTLYRNFWKPLAVAVLNTECEAATARLLWPVVAETVLKGGRACRPLVARQGLSEALVEPALEFLRRRGVTVSLQRRLNRIGVANGRAEALEFAGERNVAVDGAVVLAVTAASAARLVPGLAVPEETRAIVNGHFRMARKPSLPEGSPLLGILGGTAEWIFVRGDVVSVTTSAADALAERDEAAIAGMLWKDVGAALGLPVDTPLPAGRIVKEKRATFAQTPAMERRRAGTRTAIHNLFLAGDWTNTGLPATIEGSIRSGFAAAAAVADQPQ